MNHLAISEIFPLRVMTGIPPVLKDYGLESQGFLQENLVRGKYTQLETIVDQIPQLFLTGTLRTELQELPLLQVQETDTKELKRLFVVYTLLTHAYLIGVPYHDKQQEIVPKSLAVPYYTLGKLLGVKPVISYTAIGLWNWRLVNNQKPVELDNMAIINCFSGSFDEQWFYLVPLGIEAIAGPCLGWIVEAQHAIMRDDQKTVQDCLSQMSIRIEQMGHLLKRMYEKCDPEVFWKRVRPYSQGSKNNQNLEFGVFFEGVTEMDEFVQPHPLPVVNGTLLEGTWRRYAGASAGQSPLIHTLDVGLDIHHRHMHETPTTPTPVNPMMEMRAYLPDNIQHFLLHLQQTSIRDYCQRTQNPDLTHHFNQCVHHFKTFRDLHIQLTTVYIILQQKKQHEKAIGTGGTDLIPFLKQTRQETEDSLLSKP
ncbi:Indoleamine 2,3-dioxygenase [Gorgonomyces haynaldii]|nr:Indoleamine 2,3-dioxygenase [Gorgonomyces haynaldii]